MSAELELKKAFFADVSPALLAWRKKNGLPADPLAEHRKSGYERKAAKERKCTADCARDDAGRKLCVRKKS